MCSGLDGAADPAGQAGLPAQQRGAAGHAPASSGGAQLRARPRRLPRSRSSPRRSAWTPTTSSSLLNELEELGLRHAPARPRTTAAATSSSSRTQGRDALARPPSGRRRAIEDDVLAGTRRRRNAQTLWQLLTRALHGAEPEPLARAELVGRHRHRRQRRRPAASQRDDRVDLDLRAAAAAAATPTATRAGGSSAEEGSRTPR